MFEGGAEQSMLGNQAQFEPFVALAEKPLWRVRDD
jgi:hypothetical protein